MPLWHIVHFEMVIFKKQQTQQKLWKLRSYPFVRDIYIYKEILICKGVSLSNQKEYHDSKSLETLTFGKCKALNMHNKLILVCYAFPGNLP